MDEREEQEKEDGGSGEKVLQESKSSDFLENQQY